MRLTVAEQEVRIASQIAPQTNKVTSKALQSRTAGMVYMFLRGAVSYCGLSVDLHSIRDWASQRPGRTRYESNTSSSTIACRSPAVGNTLRRGEASISPAREILLTVYPGKPLKLEATAHLCVVRDLFQCSGFESQNSCPIVVVVSRRRLFELGARFVQLGLAQLYDRTQTDVVSCLRKISGVGGMRQQLPGQVQAKKRRLPSSQAVLTSRTTRFSRSRRRCASARAVMLASARRALRRPPLDTGTFTLMPTAEYGY